MPAVIELPLGACRPLWGSARLPLPMHHLRRPTVCQMDASFAALDRAVQARDPKQCISKLVCVSKAPIQCLRDTYPALLELPALTSRVVTQLINRFISTSVSSSADVSAAQHASSAQVRRAAALCSMCKPA